MPNGRQKVISVEVRLITLMLPVNLRYPPSVERVTGILCPIAFLSSAITISSVTTSGLTRVTSTI